MTIRRCYLLTAAALIVITALFVMPSPAFAAPHLVGPGHFHVDTDIYHVGEDADQGTGNSGDQYSDGSGTDMDGTDVDGTYNVDEELNLRGASLEATWDPRTLTWYKNGKIAVKDQGNSNTCWACSAASAAEISYAKETSKAVNVISAPQIAYFFFNRPNDPLGLTGGDKNQVVYKDWNLNGGSCVYTYQHLATWAGAIKDGATEKASLKYLREYYKSNPNRTAPTNLLAQDYAYNKDYLTLENAVYYDKLTNNTANRNKVKQLIKTYGAVVVSINCGSRYFQNGDDDKAPYYCCDAYNMNTNPNLHEVVLVGWKDDYSKSNFNSTTAGGKKNQKPSANGAWIMQNSWGTSCGENGYYYISYESKDVLSDGILAMDMQAANTKLKYYQYDGNANNTTVQMDPGEKTANVFTAPKTNQVKISKISFTEYNDGKTTYIVDIYRGLTNSSNPTSGTKVKSMSVTTDTPGFKTIKLPSVVSVDAGMTFSVVITYKGKTHVGVESSGSGFSASLPAKKSFYLYKGKWVDAASRGSQFCFRIKAVGEAYTCKHKTYQTIGTFKPAKGVQGYTLDRCTECGHPKYYDIKPMLAPVPNPTRLLAVRPAKKSAIVKWKKSTERIAGKHIDGYQLRVSKKANMKKAKIITVKKYSKTKKKLRGLKSKKKYFVQVRVFNKFNGRTYYSKWSKKKRVRIK